MYLRSQQMTSAVFLGRERQRMTSESISPCKGWGGYLYLFVCVLHTNCIILSVTVQTV